MCGQACVCVTAVCLRVCDICVSEGRRLFTATHTQPPFMYLCGSGKVENCGKLKAVHSHARGHGDSTPAATPILSCVWRSLPYLTSRFTYLTPIEFNMRATRRGDTCDWQAGKRARALVQQVRAEVRVGAWARSDHDTARKPTGHGRAAVSPRRCGGAHARPAL